MFLGRVVLVYFLLNPSSLYYNTLFSSRPTWIQDFKAAPFPPPVTVRALVFIARRAKRLLRSWKNIELCLLTSYLQ